MERVCIPEGALILAVSAGSRMLDMKVAHKEVGQAYKP